MRIGVDGEVGKAQLQVSVVALACCNVPREDPLRSLRLANASQDSGNQLVGRSWSERNPLGRGDFAFI